VYRLAKRLTDLHVATPTGKPRWNAASVRGILRNPAYAGRAQTNRTRVVPARRRKSALLPVGPGDSHAHARRRTGSRWQSRRSPRRRPSPGCRPSWTPTSRPRRATPTTSLAAGAGQLRGVPAVVHRAPDPGRLPLLPVPRAHRRAPGGPGAALRRPLHPGRAAGRAGLGRPVRAAGRSRAGRRWAGAGAGWGVAGPRAPRPPGATLRQALGQLEGQQQRLLDATWPRCSRSPSSTASGRSWTAVGPRWPPSSASWTPSPSSAWSCVPSPVGSRRSARGSGRGWPPRPSPSDGCWSSCSSTGWS
jgi:hypothetical protein